MGCFAPPSPKGSEATHQRPLGAVAYFSRFLLTCATDDVIAFEGTGTTTFETCSALRLT